MPGAIRKRYWPIVAVRARTSAVAGCSIGSSGRSNAAHSEVNRMDHLQALRAAMATVDAFYKERGIFQARFGFGKAPALVVIDMAYGWTDPAYAGGSARLDSAVAALQKLLPAARAKSIPTFFTTSPDTDPPPFKSAGDFSPKFLAWDRRACAIDE